MHSIKSILSKLAFLAVGILANGLVSAQTIERQIMWAVEAIENPGNYCPITSRTLYKELRSKNSPELGKLLPEISMCILDPTIGINHGKIYGYIYTEFVFDVEQHFGDQAGVDATLFVNEILEPMFSAIRDQKTGNTFDYARCAVIAANAVAYAQTKPYAAMYLPTLRKMQRWYTRVAGSRP